MSTNDDWDVEQHKVEHESDEHWELRRNFLLAHKDKFAEDTLVCLAQVFVNIELLGCRYPQETMDLVKELSEDVAAEYREKQKKKLQRTFVEASQAASSKVKGRSSHLQTSTVTKRSSSKDTSNIFNQDDSSQKNLATKRLSSNQMETSVSSKTNRSYEKMDTKEPPSKRPKPNDNDYTSSRNHPYGDIILWERPDDIPQNILTTSANISGANLDWEYSQRQGIWECIVYLNSKKLACCTSFNKKNAKTDAASNALNQLRKRYYTIKVKQNLDAKSNVTVTTKEIKPQKDDPDNDWKESNCIGKKMMRMMGWTGGGLGKSEQGVVEAISTTLEPQISRKGLGLKSSSCSAHEMEAKCRKLFTDFLRTSMQNDIVFLDFTSDERMMIHQIARRMGLKSRSYGPTEHRKLIVSRKIDARSLLSELKGVGGVTEKYELVNPTDERYISSTSACIPLKRDIL